MERYPINRSAQGQPRYQPASPDFERPVQDMSGDRFPVAMAYVPWQYWTNTYPLEKALQRGTLFPELDKPFLGRRIGR
ncbi:MAG: spore coat associated protein CotJA [Angelakisella sp.]|nr:spore coat associated protein CotJA [Angelakisella sp.]